jgi:hypothetical protein
MFAPVAPVATKLAAPGELARTRGNGNLLFYQLKLRADGQPRTAANRPTMACGAISEPLQLSTRAVARRGSLRCANGDSRSGANVCCRRLSASLRNFLSLVLARQDSIPRLPSHVASAWVTRKGRFVQQKISISSPLVSVKVEREIIQYYQLKRRDRRDSHSLFRIAIMTRSVRVPSARR